MRILALILFCLAGLVHSAFAKTTPLGNRPDWSELDKFQETITRERFIEWLANIYAPGDAAVGVIAVEMSVKEEDVSVVNVHMHPHDSGNWTIDGSVTTQYEQHLRAILDLPLGDPSMTAKYVVTGNFYCGDKPNMYRPYLHLMARTPALKFHQYKNSGVPGELMGHITLAGDDLLKVIEEIEHALQYLQGEIDE